MTTPTARPHDRTTTGSKAKMSVDGDVATGAEGTDPQQEKVLK